MIQYRFSTYFVIACLGATLVSCVLYDGGSSSVPPACSRRASKVDGEACRCDEDCLAGAWCASEREYQFPHGYCVHGCRRDADCTDGYACEEGFCAPRCASFSDCAAGRVCTLTDRPGASVCMPGCDEAADCDSGNCNSYSQRCLPRGERPFGSGVAASCTDDGDCRSGWCSAGKCTTPCDPSLPRCPEDAVCDRSGYCTPRASCDDEDAGMSCQAPDRS